MKIKIPIPAHIILEAEIAAAKEIVDKFNKEYSDQTGNLRNSIGWQQHEGKIYILKGMDIIAII